MENILMLNVLYKEWTIVAQLVYFIKLDGNF